MKEAINIVFNLKVPQSIWDYLEEKTNKSEFIRDLIHNEMILEAKRGKNKTLVQ